MIHGLGTASPGRRAWGMALRVSRSGRRKPLPRSIVDWGCFAASSLGLLTRAISRQTLPRRSRSFEDASRRACVRPLDSRKGRPCHAELRADLDYLIEGHAIMLFVMNRIAIEIEKMASGMRLSSDRRAPAGTVAERGRPAAHPRIQRRPRAGVACAHDLDGRPQDFGAVLNQAGPSRRDVRRWAGKVRRSRARVGAVEVRLLFPIGRIPVHILVKLFLDVVQQPVMTPAIPML
jgi:hypothetical protein